MSRFASLDGWLDWLEKLHPVDIDLGLERVYAVASKLALLQPSDKSLQTDNPLKPYCSGRLQYPDQLRVSRVITVAGTNGKGSCVRTLEQALLLNHDTASGPKVGAYTSPHLHHYCERIRIDGKQVTESTVCDAFAAIDAARGDISLSYFEFGTLAALLIFVQAGVPFVLLEVGLGGRLDAVNIVDADIAVITSIAIDHEAWLGSDRNGISQEKLGVSRRATPLIITEEDLTPALEAACEQAQTYCIDRDFSVNTLSEQEWQLTTQDNQWQLPLPNLPLNSVAAALVALAILKQLPPASALEELMANVSLAGRYERTVIDGVEVIFDVAHNPAAAAALARRLTTRPAKGETLAVMAVMADKDIPHILEPMAPTIDQWFIGDLAIPRAAASQSVKEALLEVGAKEKDIVLVKDAVDGFQRALAEASSHDRIVVFGSFYTVSAVQARYTLSHSTLHE